MSENKEVKVELGIENTKEIIAAMAEMSVCGKKAVIVLKKILEDGISLSDVMYINELIEATPDMDLINKAIEDAGVSIDELKDLDEVEVLGIVGEVYKAVKRFKDA